MQTFIIYEHLISEENVTNRIVSVRSIIREEELLVGNRGNLCLPLRFKNCTGNIIDLTDRITELSTADSILAYFPFSIDPDFKNFRHRTLLQTIVMVLRWRLISMGYYDFHLQRHVKPMNHDQAAKNLSLRH